MDMTITTDKVMTLLRTLPSTDRCPNAKNIRALRLHIKWALQLLPCPQSIHLGWKGLAMSQGMYALLVTGGNAFQLLLDSSAAAVYARANLADTMPLNCTEQATLNTRLA